MFVKGAKFPKWGPNFLGNMAPGGPNFLGNLARGGQIFGGAKFPVTPAIDSTGQNTLYAWISRDSDYCITKYKPNLVETCAHGNFRHYKSACKHACIQRIQTKLSV